jgi:hypothetical protein
MNIDINSIQATTAPTKQYVIDVSTLPTGKDHPVASCGIEQSIFRDFG